MKTLLITRNQYDNLLGTTILSKFLAIYQFTWSLAGVTFRNVSDENVRHIYETLNGIR